MMPLIWTEHLSIGNALLDFEHKSMLGMINNIEFTIKRNDSFALLTAIKSFKDNVHAHFANEARFAQMASLDFEQHDLGHQHLLQELDSTLFDLESKITISDDTWCKYAMEYYPALLRDWHIKHITSEDMEMKPVLQSYPFDFKPA